MIEESTFERIGLFAGLRAEARRELRARGTLVRFGLGEVLWTAGSEARGLFVVVAGRVRVVRGRDGRQHVLHTEGPGGTLGEVPLFEGSRYPATALTAEPTLCAHFGRGALEAAIALDPEVAFLLLRRLAGRVRHLIDRLDGMTHGSVTGRLATLLLDRHRTGGLVAGLGGSQAQVAEELGTVREVLVRELRRLREAGVIESAGRGRVRVVDEAALRALAGER